ncbi:MAG: HAD-IIA family hydrolase [Chloroflexota bacterium]
MNFQLGKIRALVIDADGVLWRGRQPLPGVPAFFDFLRARNIPYIIATNNSARPESDVVEKLTRYGTQIEESHVLTSSLATALSLPRVAPNAKRVLIVGGEWLGIVMTRAGYQVVEQDADVVIAGIDMNLTYDKLRRATLEIRRGAKFIGTNADKTFPSEEGIIPGAGSILAALQAASETAPIVIGKPERMMFDIAVEKMGVPPELTATLGDRLETDILGGQRAGLRSILVMTGVTTPAMLAQSSIQPDCVFDDLVALREAWERAY